MAKKYVGAVTLQALMEIIQGELGTQTTQITNLLETVVKNENVVKDLDAYTAPGEGEDDNKVVSAQVVKELKDIIDQLSGVGADGADGKDAVAVKFGDMIKTWDDYDEAADQIVAATLIKAIKDELATLSETVAEELEGQKGEAGGIATLDENGKVPAEQLPSYVDDVIEGFMVEDNSGESPVRTFYEPNEDGTAATTTTIAGEKGKIYIDLNTSYSYRWSGTMFVRVNEVDLVEITEDEVEAIWNEVVAEFEAKADAE